MEQQLMEVEQSIKQCQSNIELAEALMRLQENQDFQKVFTQTYQVDELLRLVHLKAATITPDQIERLERMIMGVVAFESFCDMMINSGIESEAALADAKQARVEILAED